ncbi:SIMPL domain-containing protein [Flavobacterium sp.]|uniref:SIMPL domain-containing protein n=1 Tax=Flavobacterium sp. TaxID=239 RepID=UPI0034571225
MMRKAILILTMMTTWISLSQEQSKTIPQIAISGEGKVKVTPDIAVITLGVQNSGKEAKEVKTQNDVVVDKVLKYIKKFNISASDYQTTQMSLHKNYDYEKKKYSYEANQTITVTLKDLSKYDLLMMDVMETGINKIDGVEFKSSKIEQYETEARKKAMLNAKKKAEDYLSVLPGQKIGKAILISDNSSTYYPRPVFYAKGVVMNETRDERETLAVGEIEVISNVNVSFVLE